MNIIVAACKNRGIGFKNKLPWNLPKELQYFKGRTIGKGNNAVIMGKNTYLSLDKPLPKRDNFVLSSTLKQSNNGFNVIPNLDSLKKKNYDTIWIIGGAQVYESMINNYMVNTIYYTDIDKECECDTFFPEIPSSFNKMVESACFDEKGIGYTIKIYTKNVDQYYLCD